MDRAILQIIAQFDMAQFVGDKERLLKLGASPFVDDELIMRHEGSSTSLKHGTSRRG